MDQFAGDSKFPESRLSSGSHTPTGSALPEISAVFPVKALDPAPVRRSCPNEVTCGLIGPSPRIVPRPPAEGCIRRESEVYAGPLVGINRS